MIFMAVGDSCRAEWLNRSKAATFTGSMQVVSMPCERMAKGANTTHRQHNPSPARSIAGMIHSIPVLGG
jgi:hypothetical protein